VDARSFHRCGKEIERLNSDILILNFVTKKAEVASCRRKSAQNEQNSSQQQNILHSFSSNLGARNKTEKQACFFLWAECRSGEGCHAFCPSLKISEQCSIVSSKRERAICRAFRNILIYSTAKVPFQYIFLQNLLLRLTRSWTPVRSPHNFENVVIQTRKRSGLSIRNLGEEQVLPNRSDRGL
jgi:hypothetical protein